MTSTASAKLLIIFAVAFSLATLPGPLSLGNAFTSRLPSVHAVGPAVPSKWYPAGPVTDAVSYVMYGDEGAEYTGLQNHEIDFTDWTADAATAASLQADPDFVTTTPLSDAGHFELQFNMANNYFGCAFNFGNSPCGQDIRQAFAHAVDKNKFSQVELANHGTSLDHPDTPIVELNHPNPCNWDALYPQTGPGCQVNGPQGTAYQLPGHTTCGLTAGCGTTVPFFSYVAGLGTADFCAAAEHLLHSGVFTGATIDANLDGSGKPIVDGVHTCKLSNVPASVASNGIHIYVRSDNNPRLHVGSGYAEFLCGILTGVFSTGCPSSGVIMDQGPITAFCGFTTSTTTVNTCWWIYTAGFSLNFLSFDASLYFGIHSRFVSGIPSIKRPSPGAFCDSAAQPSFAAGNYMNICSPAYDDIVSQAEFSPCLTAVGDPITGQTTPTFADCPSTSVLSAASAAYQAEDVYGQNVFTIPWWAGINTFAFQNNGWNRAILQKGSGQQANQNFFLLLNAYCTPSTANTAAFACNTGLLRQGFKQATGSVNPYIGNTEWDAGVINAVYDSAGTFNPNSPSTYLEWMTYRTDFIQPASLGYSTAGIPLPAGQTVLGAFRYNLRGDIFFHDGEQVSAWDLAFSATSTRAAGLALTPIVGVKVLSKTQVDLIIGQIGPSTKLSLNPSAIPGHLWTATCPGSGTAAQNWHSLLASGANLNACLAPSASITAAGVIVPDSGFGWHSNVDFGKLQPSYDNSTPTNANLIGSSAWECKNSSGGIGGDCSSSHNAAPPVGGTWTLSRFGTGKCTGLLCTTSGFPGPQATYFRSNANLALYIWTNNNGRADTSDFNNLAVVDGPQCFGASHIGATGCTRWQTGIGNPETTPGTLQAIGTNQVSEVVRFYRLNWVAPYDWVNSPPDNIAQPFSSSNSGSDANGIVLYEGTQVLNPCSLDAAHGYDC